MATDQGDDEPLLNNPKKPRKSSPPPIVDDNPALAKREANKVRIVSLQHCATLLGYDRNTVEKWVKQESCPYVTKADRDRGLAWELDLATVVRWLQERAVKNATGGSDDGDGTISVSASKKRREDALAIMAELEAAELLRLVVPRQAVVDRVQKDYNEIKKRLMTLPAAIAGRMDASIQRAAREIADEQVRVIIEKLRVDEVLKAADAPSSDPDAEE